ncbi:DUF1493 family protein [Salmonella enterica subsp. enterica]|nr:DUF1493 family protein [Salmonella enterica subsp. enterica serovar Kua]ECG9328985.1 DUF1493 family protein [Salmonella enterica]EDU3844556.1 DUF1493 family protein [Salmonella enterica subsp. enterica serovar Essen]
MLIASAKAGRWLYD